MNTTNLSVFEPQLITASHSPYVTSNKTKIAKSFTISYAFNRRGIENPAYGLYSTIFSELTDGLDSLVTQVNASLALEYYDGQLGRPIVNVIDEDYEPEYFGPPDSDSDSLDSEPPPDFEELAREVADLRLELEDFEDFAGFELPLESSEHSPTATQSGRDIHIEGSSIGSTSDSDVSTPSDLTESNILKEFFPDIAIRYIRTRAMPLPNPDRLPPVVKTPHGPSKRTLRREQVHFLRRLGAQITFLLPALVGEVKCGPSRIWDPIRPEFRNQLKVRMEEATTQLMIYAAAVFAAYPGIEEFAGFVATGIYWAWALIKVDDVPDRDWNTQDNDGKCSGRALTEFRSTFGAKFARYYEVGTPESDRAFTELRDDYLYAVATSDGCAIFPNLQNI